MQDRGSEIVFIVANADINMILLNYMIYVNCYF